MAAAPDASATPALTPQCLFPGSPFGLQIGFLPLATHLLLTPTPRAPLMPQSLCCAPMQEGELWLSVWP